MKPLTLRQAAYVRHRSSGMGGAEAARAAGYSTRTAKQIAVKLERNSGVRAALSRTAPQAPEPPSAAVISAEEYLVAVVSGAVPADAVRVSAARTLIQYQAGRQRRPLPPEKSPRQSAQIERRADESALLKDWERETAYLHERYSRDD